MDFKEEVKKFNMSNIEGSESWVRNVKSIYNNIGVGYDRHINIQ